ncbi:MAG: endonuclease domain-containing protein [Ignavibacteria bacterium]
MKKLNLKYSPSNTIVCWLKQKSDLSILLNEGWYRIPVKTNLENLHKVKYLAFYQSYAFGKAACIIKHYGTIEKIEIAKRTELFPKEKPNEKSNDEYYKIKMKDMNILETPIPSKRNRRIIFINTTLEKLLSATEVNDLYNESPLEDVLWNGMKQNNIVAERQYFLRGNNNMYCLDFAAFCKKGNLNIECDGDAYHIGKEKAVKDNRRDNYLTKKGWSILRYSTTQLHDTDECISEIRESISQKGGILL